MTFNETDHPRAADGQFAEKLGAAPDVALDTTPAPISAKVVHQRWVNDYAQETGEETEFDIRAVLDAASLDDIRAMESSGDREWLHDDAVTAGILEPADGPYYVDTFFIEEQLEEYIEVREAAGQEEPLGPLKPSPALLQKQAGAALNLAHDEVPVLSVLDENEGSERIRDQFRHAAAKLDGIDENDGLSYQDTLAIRELREFVAESEDVNLNNVHDERDYRKKAVLISAGLADWLLNRDFAYSRAGN